MVKGKSSKLSIDRAGVPEKDFVELLKMVPDRQFYTMVQKSNLPVKEAHDLCRIFTELKG